LLLPIKVDQYIFFPETFFASTISKPEFTVCVGKKCLYLSAGVWMSEFSWINDTKTVKFWKRLAKDA
jgi:hypothetical protein